MDEVIVCADCRSEFTFTASEATFFTSKGLTKPRRCKVCRQKRRDAKPSEAALSKPKAAVTQWMGGGEVAAPRRNGRDRKRDRNYDDHNS